MPLPRGRGPVNFPGLGWQGQSRRNTQGIGEAQVVPGPPALYHEQLAGAQGERVGSTLGSPGVHQQRRSCLVGCRCGEGPLSTSRVRTEPHFARSAPTTTRAPYLLRNLGLVQAPLLGLVNATPPSRPHLRHWRVTSDSVPPSDVENWSL